MGAGCFFLGVLSGESRVNVQGMAGRSAVSYRLTDLLTIGTMGSVAIYVVLYADSASSRYLTPAIVFGSILAAVLCGQLIGKVVTQRSKRSLVVASIVICTAYGSIAAMSIARPSQISSFIQLTTFLEQHHLSRGVGDYWSSAPTTVYSSGNVLVRQVEPLPNGGIGPQLVIADSDWYTAPFQFLLYNVGESSGASIRAASQFPFAAVAYNYRVGEYRIVVWESPQTMSRLARSS